MADWNFADGTKPEEAPEEVPEDIIYKKSRPGLGSQPGNME